MEKEQGTMEKEQDVMEKRKAVAEIIQRHAKEPGALIPILHEAQEHFGYIPRDVQGMIAAGLRMPIADVYGVITFYSRFSLTPQGKNRVSICMGTACYVRGAEDVLHEVKKQLGVDTGQTTEDGLFTIEETRCVGACGLAPIMTVNRDVYGKITPGQVEGILTKYKEATQ